MPSLPKLGGVIVLAAAALTAPPVEAQTFNLLSGWPQANGIVHAMALDEANGTLYIGGVFTQVDGQSRERLAAIDISTGTLTSWAPGADNAVLDIALRGDSVIIGGQFTTVNGQSRTHLAALDAATGTLSAWAPVINGNVNCLLADASVLYVGGAFTQADGQVRNRLAAFGSGSGALTAWNPDASSAVNDLEWNGTDIVVAGVFTSVGGSSRLRLAGLDASSGAATAWVADADATASCLVVADGRLFAGGLFTTVNGTARSGVAELSPADGSVQTWSANIAGGTVRSLVLDGNMLFAGGFYGTVNGSGHTHLAALDATTGALLSGSPEASSTINRLIAYDSKLYAAGAFTAVNGGSRDRFAVWSYCTEQAWYADADEDGLGDNGVMVMACTAPTGYVADNSDCDDNDDAIGAATTWYVDADGDEFGDPFSPIVACVQPPGTAEEPTDCDDDDDSIFPTADCDDGDPYTVVDQLQAFPACGCQGRQVVVAATVLLEGAYDPTSGLMRDDLRAAGLLPLTEPYTSLGYTVASDTLFPSIAGGDQTTADVLAVTGPDAIVDWVVLELRSIQNTQAIALSTRYVLVQRDGDIVEPDGVSPVRFPIPYAHYRLSVLHRNHMGILEAWGDLFNGSYYENEERDFTSAGFNMEGDAPRAQAGPLLLLRAGDTSFNDEVIYVGPANDRDPILSYIGGSIPTNIVPNVYSIMDTNMDGMVKYVGQGNDRDFILQTIGGTVPTAIRPHVYRSPTY